MILQSKNILLIPICELFLSNCFSCDFVDYLLDVSNDLHDKFSFTMTKQDLAEILTNQTYCRNDMDVFVRVMKVCDEAIPYVRSNKVTLGVLAGCSVRK